MSKSQYVEYADDGFWAYDVAIGVFLKHLIDVAERRTIEPENSWLSPCIEQWRINIIVSDYGLYLDETWSDTQRQTICELIDDACTQLRKRPSIPSDEMLGWDVLDGQGVDSRGAIQFPAAPVLELAQAVQALLCGTFPSAPEGHLWFYGTESGRTAIKKQIE